MNLLSKCCNAEVLGHPNSPSGDPTRCTKCGKECGTFEDYKCYPVTEPLQLKKCPHGFDVTCLTCDSIKQSNLSLIERIEKEVKRLQKEVLETHTEDGYRCTLTNFEGFLSTLKKELE